MKRIEVNPGDKYNRLTIIEEVEKVGKERRFLCECDCGTIKKILLCHLRRKKGMIESCGCYNLEIVTKHGMCGTRFYRIWECMLSRCYNPNNDMYKNYGGRGITVCDRWKDNFINFYNDMKKGYKDNLTIERIDVNGNYNKSNCTWATRKEQASNKRDTIRYNGKCLKDNCRELGLNYNTVFGRVKYYNYSIEEALELNNNR